jgi:hypothetical protein
MDYQMERSDAQLIKHLMAPDIDVPHLEVKSRLLSCLPELGRVYNALPLFLLPEHTEELFRYELDFLALLQRDQLRLPFNDSLMDFPCGWFSLLAAVHHLHGSTSPIDIPSMGHLWTRVRLASEAAEYKFLLIPRDAIIEVTAGDLDDFVLIEGWQFLGDTTYLAIARAVEPTLSAEQVEAFATADAKDKFRGVHNHMQDFPTFSLVPVREAWNPKSFYHLDIQYCEIGDVDWISGDELSPPTSGVEKEEFEEHGICGTGVLLSRTFAICTVLALTYWTHVAATVRVTPARPMGRKSEKTALLKPWLTPRPSHHISVDPARLEDYDHPSSHLVGERHAPRPHRRRGHWRKYPADGRWKVASTFVREAWIGAREWKDQQGNAYKLVDPFFGA